MALKPASATSKPGRPDTQPISQIQIRPFQPGDETPFRTLNEAWISKYFTIEDADRILLEHPVANIVQAGGHIVMAMAGHKAIGCCALLANGPGEFELAKMAVLESERGRGIGRRIIEYTINYARSLGARRLYLETNSKLANAIHLYEAVGFRHVSPGELPPTPYARADVFMEMKLSD
jgi:putative acetyltransferase